MGLYKENPRYRCVSTRLSEDEWEELLRVCNRSRKNMSQFIREALSALLVDRSRRKNRANN